MGTLPALSIVFHDDDCGFEILGFLLHCHTHLPYLDRFKRSIKLVVDL